MTQSNKQNPQSAGDIDLSFGVNGEVKLTEGSIRAVTDDGEGLILAVWIDEETQLHRVLSDGSKDLTFGDNGVVKCQFEKDEDARPEQLIRQADGKFLLVGSSIRTHFLWRTAVSRFHPNGRPDLEYGTKIFPYPYDPDSVRFYPHRPVACLQADGKLLVSSGYRVDDVDGRPIYEAGRLHRLDVNGLSDRGFGIDGQIEIRIKGQDTRIEGIGALPDAKIVVSATLDRVKDDTSNARISVACLESNGKLDQTFADGGYWEAKNYSSSAKMTVDDDKIILLGTEKRDGAAVSTFSMFKLMPDGKPDPTFNDGAPLPIDVGEGRLFPVTVMHSKQRIVALVYRFDGDIWIHVMRVHNRGELDLDFGGAGSIKLGPGDASDGIVQGNSGRIILAADCGSYTTKKEPTVIGILS
ncbi:hypothetical protein HCU66_15410 [Pseudomonas frederiksbergensis]|uniref:hypothetical protein n=1 Tax=Pseudomonas frederiksbergensis TaxID=104087 RepID=UPI00197EEA0C|nr:hypothetical protein [Pseudomonas frederiksbergensis]MBN3863625.1 hypothetical protein [Pseudomonas frederiksbergensis]